MALVDHVDWHSLDNLVAEQQRNRAAHTPVISLFRWWARRPHCFAGAVLDAARKELRRETFLVADPFSGGGTVAFEAVRRRLPIYAQDLYPWPSRALATALTETVPEEFGSAASALLETLNPLRKSYFRRRGQEDWEVSHIIRVRTTECPQCSKRIYLFREALISLCSRSSKEEYALFGCTACGAISRRRRGVRTFICDSCRVRSGTRVPSTLLKAQFRCPHCAGSFDLSDVIGSTIEWHPVLIREHSLSDPTSTRLRVATDEDPVQDNVKPLDCPLRIEIPEGLETDSLKRYGFRFWDDIYPQKQLDIITSALSEASKLKASVPVKEHLRLAILGAAEMAGYLCRWERYHPKALEAIANHRFSRSTIAVETNLLSPCGRGTLPRRFRATEKALRWMKSNGFSMPTMYAESSNRRRVVHGALVVTGSSEKQLLRTGSAQLVFTDPPYHDDLQYGELARLFHVWMGEYPTVEARHEKLEAVPNKVRGTTTKDYEDSIAACLRESSRALARDGRLLLTFHNRDLRAWKALARALLRAGFYVVGLATVTAENSADHSKRGKQCFMSDLVIECRPKRRARYRARQLMVRGVRRTLERRNLQAIGYALAEFINNGGGDLEKLFAKHTVRLKVSQVLIRAGG